MFHGDRKRLLLVAAFMAIAGLTAACESDAERKARLEREAHTKQLDIEELKKQLETVNPDPYAPKKNSAPPIKRKNL